MQTHCLYEDVTLKKTIGSMKECKITDHVIEHLKCDPEEHLKCPPEDNLKCAPKDTLSKTIEVIDLVNSTNSRKRKRKKSNLKRNREPKKPALRSLKWHKKHLTKRGFYDPENLVESMPTTPSYSIMHSLRDGFEILMYSGSHRLKLSPRLCLHHADAVRIILPEWMMIIWHESLYHAGAKSRNNSEDMRFFSYVYPDNDRSAYSRTKGTTDGVAREIGD